MDAEARSSGSSFGSGPQRSGPAEAVSTDTRAPAGFSERRQDVRSGVHRADGGDIRPARPGAEVGRATVSYDNAIGLVLAIVVALFLFAALLFPERF